MRPFIKQTLDLYSKKLSQKLGQGESVGKVMAKLYRATTVRSVQHWDIHRKITILGFYIYLSLSSQPK